MNSYPCNDEKQMLAESVVTLFPSLKIKMEEENEGFEHFYDPVSHSGFIEMRLRNLRRKLHDDQRRYQRKRIRISASSGVSITLDITAEGEEDSTQEWTTVIKRMKPSPENLNTIKLGMEKTYSIRRLWIANTSPQCKRFLNSMKDFGYELDTCSTVLVSHSVNAFVSDQIILRIVLLGKSVSENSQVGNFILGRAAFDSEAPPNVVERVGGRLKNRHVIIINSPQLLQTNISDHQITQTVRECVYLSDPGPHVIVLLLKHEQCSTEDQECVEKVLQSLSKQTFQHTMVLSTQEPTETNEILQKIIQKCCNRHFSLQRSRSPDHLLQMFEDIVQMNDGHHLVCEQQATERKEKDAVKMIQEMFGEKSTVYTMVLFTKGDELRERRIEDFIENDASLKNITQQFGNRYHVFNNNETEDQMQVSELLEKIDCLLTENGGSFYTNEMFQQVEKNIKEEQERIMKEKEEEIKRKEEELKAKYEDEIEQMKKENERVRQEMQNELRKREEDFKKREEEIKKETDENVQKELQRKLEEQQKLSEEENKRKEKALGEQQQKFINHLEKKHEEEKQTLKERIQHETRQQAEREYLRKLETEVARALKEAEEKLPYRSKRARDWGDYVPLVGGVFGGAIGSVEDIVHWIIKLRKGQTQTEVESQNQTEGSLTPSEIRPLNQQQ
ncbi:GTPase IMAP family member 7-like isoform X1 [Labeo rohita]|uniref:GTPase IMAP family member 7-like isoform X1 n=1 Tax=Labeo rohita TaxID=84645 RepID=A0A498L8I0_LABRO|nr:GTPase IMAP family member 7-like isoform X1 [Labeo rohita]RXN23595.1 GTPase IMAP family member 7-like isoform X1 [Labeo rohita]